MHGSIVITSNEDNDIFLEKTVIAILLIEVSLISAWSCPPLPYLVPSISCPLSHAIPGAHH